LGGEAGVDSAQFGFNYAAEGLKVGIGGYFGGIGAAVLLLPLFEGGLGSFHCIWGDVNT
jgi:hypothetical protein